MELSENSWKKIRFTLIFLWSAGVLFILITKFFITVPMLESKEILSDIRHSEQILTAQKQYASRVVAIHDTIKTIAFEINQVQKLDDIKRDIYALEDIYKINNRNNKYLFGIQASRILKIYFDSNEALNKSIKNNQLIERNLNECKANL
ncbi:type VI secretion system TssO [Mariniflexile ostreae]|uniref:Type VI secretion system TssO n=1 Tax=Mariniflexile ostreae TaxID=1520892 RepID=A0ABV5F9Y7_9FLAO